MVSVFPERGATGTPEIDSYVYDSHRLLLAKDIEESVTERFEWRAPVDASVYVIARNVGLHAGTVVIQVFRARAATTTARGATPNTALMSVYYATDRVRSQGTEEPFGTEMAKDGQMEYGLCRVSIPRDHKMGELEGPSIWKLEFTPNPAKHIALVGPPISASEQQFFSQLKTKLSGSKVKQVLVFIHGFNTTFTGAARRTAQMAYDLGFDGTALFYSWPSHGDLSPLGYNEDGRNADLSVAHLKRFLTNLTERTAVETVHLIAHSMGNRVLARAVSELAAEKSAIHFRNVILMAPDIDAELFRQMAAAMESQAQDITLYASSKDLALQASNTYAGYPRAGQGGAKIVVLPGIVTIDASFVDTSLFGALHQYYADSRTILSDVFQLLRGQPPRERFGLKQAEKDGKPYWIFKP